MRSVSLLIHALILPEYFKKYSQDFEGALEAYLFMKVIFFFL